MDRAQPSKPAAPAISTAKVADGVVILHEATGIYYHLNPAGALAYDVLRRGGTVDQVASALAHAYGTEIEVTLADLETFRVDLIRVGLVLP